MFILLAWTELFLGENQKTKITLVCRIRLSQFHELLPKPQAFATDQNALKVAQIDRGK